MPDPTPTPAPTSAPAAPAPVKHQDVSEFIQRLIGRYGSTENALQHIAGEQLKYRRRAQVAEQQANALQAKVPAADAVVLTGDEAKAYLALKSGDKEFALATVGPALKELGDLKTAATRKTREDALTNAAGQRYNPKLLAKLVGDTPIEFKTVMERDPEDPAKMVEVSVPYVKHGDTLEMLDTWLTREHNDIMDALRISPEDAGRSTTPTGPAATMPRQSAPAPGTQSGPKGKSAQLLQQVDRGLSVHMTPAQRRKEAAGG